MVERAETFAFAHIVAIGAGCGEAELSTSRTFAEIFTVLCLCTFDRRTYATVTDDGLPATAVTVCVTCTIALAASAGCSCFDTDTILDEDEEGLLLVRGPNVMQGYLDEPEKTEAVLKERWYNTGDVARIDKEGYIYITGRLSRFSKIGGEMVPHIALEEEIHKAMGIDKQTLAVVSSVPDESRGERLVGLHLELPLEPKDIIANLREQGIPNLWVPKPNMFFLIEKIPILGSGKLDLRAIKELALEKTGAVSAV